MRLRIKQIRDCPQCKAHLKQHYPAFTGSLRMIQQEYQYPSGSWKHNTKFGRRLHKMVEEWNS